MKIFHKFNRLRHTVSEHSQRIEELYGIVSEKHEMIEADRQRIYELYRLASEKHEMIVAERQKIAELYQLISEKHEMIVANCQKISELYSLVSEKHEMIAADRQKIEHLYYLASEKHEMILSVRQDLNVLMKYAVLYYWQDREQTKELSSVLEWVKSNGIAMYPYSWTAEYANREVDLLKDETGWQYLVHNGKNLYFPKDFDEGRIKKYYSFLLMEQDHRSPHCYFSKKYEVMEDDFIWYDVGAAEGIMMLDHMDQIKRGYLIECEHAWAEALRRTFAPYRDRVRVIEKAADSFTDESHVALKDLMDLHEKCLIKVDVEGNEEKVLRGIDWKGVMPESKVIVCAYHHQEDEKVLGEYLTRQKIVYEMSDGYILPDWGGGIQEPFFRRGLFRGIKE